MVDFEIWSSNVVKSGVIDVVTVFVMEFCIKFVVFRQTIGVSSTDLLDLLIFSKSITS